MGESNTDLCRCGHTRGEHGHSNSTTYPYECATCPCHDYIPAIRIAIPDSKPEISGNDIADQI